MQTKWLVFKWNAKLGYKGLSSWRTCSTLTKNTNSPIDLLLNSDLFSSSLVTSKFTRKRKFPSCTEKLSKQLFSSYIFNTCLKLRLSLQLRQTFNYLLLVRLSNFSHILSLESAKIYFILLLKTSTCSIILTFVSLQVLIPHDNNEFPRELLNGNCKRKLLR